MHRWKRALAFPVTLVAVALGFLIAIQVQTQKSVSAAQEIQKQRVASIRSYLDESAKDNEALKAQHSELLNQLEEARKQGGIDPDILAQMSQVNIMNGTQAVSGPGIQLVIDDRGRQDNQIVIPISPSDLMSIVNTLRLAGAEAISINGQRIVGGSAIVYSGSNILINQVPIGRSEGPPYEILAIGNQEVLDDYVSGVEADSLKDKGVKFSIASKMVTIPSYIGSNYVFDVAEPMSKYLGR